MTSNILPWVILILFTAVLNVAIHLHMRGLPAGGTASNPNPPNGEIEAASVAAAHVAATGDADIPPDDTVTFPTESSTPSNGPAAFADETVATLPEVIQPRDGKTAHAATAGDPDIRPNNKAASLAETIASRNETVTSANETAAASSVESNLSAEEMLLFRDETVATQPDSAIQPRDVVEELPAVLYRDDLAKANALRDQSTALSVRGQQREALTAITEATKVLRALASAHPAAFNADFALFLRSLSLRLSDVGSAEEALAAIKEAMDIQRGLVSECPSEFNVELASSLSHHSNRLLRLGRHEESLLSAQESVDLYRAAADEQTAMSYPGLAASLYNLSSRFSKYDLQEEALVAIREASNLYRDLAATQPELYSSRLAASREKMTSCLNSLGKQEEAFSVGQEADFTQNPGALPSLGEAATPAPTDEIVAIQQEVIQSRDLVGGRSAVQAQSEIIRRNVFNTVGTGSSSIINVAGNHIIQTQEEDPVTKISRMLTYAEGASWDPQLTCLPGTRVAMLSIIDAWAHQADSNSVCWIKGVAGSGKSAILHTIAQKLQQEGRLGSSFFFSRDTATRNTPQTLFTSIARDLANLHPGAAEHIARALEAEPALVSASPSRQFDALILGPSHHLPVDQPIILLIDALDESISHDLDTELLSILRDKATQLPSQIRLLITSRPTSMIEEYLSGGSHVTMHSIDIFSVENKRDIDMYVDVQLRDQTVLRKMGQTVPDEAVIRDLKRLAEGLFIWIVTVCNFLRTAYKPRAKLQALLSKSFQQGSPPEKKMDQLYAVILAENGDWKDVDFVKDYDLVIGTIMAAKRPLSLAALRALHDGTQEFDPDQLLHRFGSVLIGFRDPHQPIRILHLSFHEFVTDRAAHDDSTRQFYISEKAHSGRLAELCIKTLNHELEKPLPGTGHLAKHSHAVTGIPQMLGLSEQLVYGCAHWTDHLPDVEEPHVIRNHLIPLLSRHFVTWMEIVASADVFRGSVVIRQWLQRYAPELEYHCQLKIQADALLELGNHLGDAGRSAEALLASQETITLYRELVAKQPAAPHRASLALALNNLCVCLGKLGHAQESLPVVQEAVLLYRALSAEQGMIQYAPLALALQNLSGQLISLGRAPEALPSAQESVDLRRILAAEQPAAHNEHLARVLMNLSMCLAAVDQLQEALMVIQEAVELYRALIVEQPVEQRMGQPTEHSAGLAGALLNLSNYLPGLGRANEALPAIEEAVKLRRTLVAEQLAQGNVKVTAACNQELAKALNNLSLLLSQFDRHQEALETAEKAVELYRDVVYECPGPYQADLANALGHISRRLSKLGQCKEALGAVGEAVDLYRDLAAKNPVMHRGTFARFLEQFSRQLLHFGRLEEASSALLEAIEIFRDLATEQPEKFKPPLLVSLCTLAKVLNESGLEECSEVEWEAITMREAWEGELPHELVHLEAPSSRHHD